MKIHNKSYIGQKDAARRRNIEWNFTYDTWVEWWGEDIVNRGKGPGKLCMARFEDKGPYHPDNCKKITHGENVREARVGKPLSEETKLKISLAKLGVPHAH